MLHSYVVLSLKPILFLPHIEDVTVALAEKAEDDSTMWDEITKKRQAIKKLYPKP